MNVGVRSRHTVHFSLIVTVQWHRLNAVKFQLVSDKYAFKSQPFLQMLFMAVFRFCKWCTLATIKDSISVIAGWLTHSWFLRDCLQPVEKPCQSLLSWCYFSHPAASSLASGLCGCKRWQTTCLRNITYITSLCLAVYLGNFLFNTVYIQWNSVWFYTDITVHLFSIMNFTLCSLFTFLC